MFSLSLVTTSNQVKAALTLIMNSSLSELGKSSKTSLSSTILLLAMYSGTAGAARADCAGCATVAFCAKGTRKSPPLQQTIGWLPVEAQLLDQGWRYPSTIWSHSHSVIHNIFLGGFPYSIPKLISG